MKAREWYERGKQAADPIDALTDFWRGFNNLYASGDKVAEREKIRRFLRNIVSEAEAEQLLAAHSAGVGYLFSEPVIDMRGNGRDTGPNIDAFNVSTGSIAKLEEVFMVIYQVRCNLEHGQKSPNRERDLRLCESAAPIVAQILELTHNSAAPADQKAPLPGR